MKQAYITDFLFGWGGGKNNKNKKRRETINYVSLSHILCFTMTRTVPSDGNAATMDKKIRLMMHNSVLGIEIVDCVLDRRYIPWRK